MTDESQQMAARPRRRDWDGVAAVIAACVGLLALCVSGYTAYIQRQQVRAQVWPYLQFEYSNVLAHLEWRNQGMGPAIVHSVQAFIGDKPLHNWRELRESLGLDVHFQSSSMNGMVLTPGQSLEWMKFKDPEDFARFYEAEKRMKFRYKVCYCSTLDECWLLDSDTPKRQPVDNCPALSAADEFND